MVSQAAPDTLLVGPHAPWLYITISYIFSGVSACCAPAYQLVDELIVRVFASNFHGDVHGRWTHWNNIITLLTVRCTPVYITNVSNEPAIACTLLMT